MNSADYNDPVLEAKWLAEQRTNIQRYLERENDAPTFLPMSATSFYPVVTRTFFLSFRLRHRKAMRPSAPMFRSLLAISAILIVETSNFAQELL